MPNEQLDKYVQQESQSASTVKIDLTIQELNIVMGALQELPHRAVDSLLRKIMGQAQSQFSTQPQVSPMQPPLQGFNGAPLK